jgi:hypothetical protein
LPHTLPDGEDLKFLEQFRVHPGIVGYLVHEA